MFSENGLSFSKCLLAVGRTDMRCGIDGLCAIVRLRYGLDPLEPGTLFLFCGIRKDRIKGLLWTGDRFVLLYDLGRSRTYRSLSLKNPGQSAILQSHLPGYCKEHGTHIIRAYAWTSPKVIKGREDTAIQ